MDVYEKKKVIEKVTFLVQKLPDALFPAGIEFRLIEKDNARLNLLIKEAHKRHDGKLAEM